MNAKEIKMLPQFKELLRCKKDESVQPLLVMLGIHECCGRCGGSGHYSYNLMYGTVCFGCRGSGKKACKLDKKSFEAAKLKVDSGEFDQMIKDNRERKARIKKLEGWNDEFYRAWGEHPIQKMWDKKWDDDDCPAIYHEMNAFCAKLHDSVSNDQTELRHGIFVRNKNSSRGVYRKLTNEEVDERCKRLEEAMEKLKAYLESLPSTQSPQVAV